MSDLISIANFAAPTATTAALVLATTAAAALKYTLPRLSAVINLSIPLGPPLDQPRNWPSLTTQIGALSAADERVYRRTVPAAKVVKKEQWKNRAPYECILAAEQPHPDRNGLPNCEWDRLSVTEVWFDDAPVSWIVCRCSDTMWTEQSVFDDIGRVPVGVRQFSRNFIVFDGFGAGTVNGGGDVIVWGEGPHLYNHEVAHTVDLGSRISNWLPFRNAFAKDSCWLSDYSKMSGERTDMIYQHEIWAEAFGFDMWSRQAFKGQWPYSFTPTCASNVLKFVRDKIDPFIKAGFNPDFRPTPDTWMSWGNKRDIKQLVRKTSVLDEKERVCKKPAETHGKQ